MTTNPYKRLLEIIKGDLLAPALKEYRPKLSQALGAVSERQIQSGAVTETKIGTSAVTGTKVADTSIAFSKLAFDLNRQLAWYEDGVISAATSKGPLRRLDANVTLVSCYVYVKTAPTGAALIVDILKSTTPNGSYTSVFSATPQISASAFSGSSTSFASATLSAGDYLRMDITQVGSTVAGASLTVDLNMKVR